VKQHAEYAEAVEQWCDDARFDRLMSVDTAEEKADTALAQIAALARIVADLATDIDDHLTRRDTATEPEFTGWRPGMWRRSLTLYGDWPGYDLLLAPDGDATWIVFRFHNDGTPYTPYAPARTRILEDERPVPPPDWWTT